MKPEFCPVMGFDLKGQMDQAWNSFSIVDRIHDSQEKVSYLLYMIDLFINICSDTLCLSGSGQSSITADSYTVREKNSHTTCHTFKLKKINDFSSLHGSPFTKKMK